MKNKSLNSDTEIDLVKLTKTIWNEKLKIFLITIIFVAISFSYNQLRSDAKQEINQYNNLLIVKPTDASQFYKFKPIYNYLNSEMYQIFNSEQLNFSIKPQTEFLQINNELVLDTFINELMDYEELMFVLRKNKTVLTKISNLTDEQQTKRLYDYAKLLTFEQVRKEFDNELEYYLISFIWENSDEATKILDQTIKLVINNLKKNIFKGLEDMLNAERANILIEDAKRIEFLSEQTSIAKALNLKYDQIGNAVSSPNQYNLSLNINNNFAYYLRGYIAIDKEIEIIKNRKHVVISDLQDQLDTLKKIKIEWIKYNIYLLDTNLIKKSSKSIPLILSIVFGFIIGVIYIYFSNAFRSLKYSKR